MLAEQFFQIAAVLGVYLMQLCPVQSKVTKPVSRRAISVDDDQSVVGSLAVILDINIDSAHYADSLSRVRAQFRIAQFDQRDGLVGPHPRRQCNNCSFSYTK